MISINKAASIPIFSHLDGDIRSIENPPRTILTHIGEIIDTEINNLNDTTMFEIPNHVIMPDHIHILWRVKEWLIKDLGYYVGLFKSRCTLNCRKAFPYFSTIPQFSLFEPKFNDKISFSDEMTHRFSIYISDNPRKRLTVITHPELFNRAHRVRILDYEMDFYGIGPKYKPSGKEFDLCAEGRCLHLGLPRLSAHTDPVRRQFCLNLNAIAHWIASHPAERMHLLPNP